LLERYAARIAASPFRGSGCCRILATLSFRRDRHETISIAAQALAAVEGVREMMTHERIKAPDLEKIVIGVPTLSDG